MTSPIDLIRLTIPEPTVVQPRLDSALSLKNWSVGTLLDAIIVADQSGKLAAQILRDGMAQQPSLPLPDYPQLKSGASLQLKVTQMQPQVQLQIMANSVLNKTAALVSNTPTTPLSPALTPSAKTNVPQTQVEATKALVNNAALSAQEKLDLALSPRTNTTLPLAPVQAQRVLAQKVWSDNAQTISNTSSAMPEKNAPTFQTNMPPIPNFHERARILSQALLPISKTIWPQQRELRAVLPTLLPALNKLTTSEQDDFVAKVMQWPPALKDSVKHFLQTIPDPTELKAIPLEDSNDSAIPKPLRAWFRQWLQHQFNDETTASTEHESVDRTSTPTAKTPQQLLLLIRQILAGDGEHVDSDNSVTPKTNKAVSEPLKTDDAVIAQQKTMAIRIDATDKGSNASAQTELIELESLLQTVVARLQHQTITQVQSESRGTPQWTGELPVMHQQRLDLFDLMIEADQQNHASPAPDAAAHYVIRLRFELPELGPCQFIVQLRGSEVDINVYSERLSTQTQFVQSFEVLAQWLSLDHMHLNASDSFTIANLSERMR